MVVACASNSLLFRTQSAALAPTRELPSRPKWGRPANSAGGSIAPVIVRRLWTETAQFDEWGLLRYAWDKEGPACRAFHSLSFS
jgi:hypothetical protein